MRFVMFLSGLVALVVGVSSYFDGVPLPIQLKTRTLAVGPAEFRVDVLLMVGGTLLMLLGLLRRERYK